MNQSVNTPFNNKPSYEFFNKGSNGKYTQNASPIPGYQQLFNANQSTLQANNQLATPVTSGFDFGKWFNGTPGAQGSGIFGGDAGVLNSFSQQTNADGSTYGNWGGMGLGLAQAGYGIYSGMQNNKRADKMMDWSQDRHNMALDSYEKEKSSYYADQSTRQRTRNIDNPNSVQHDQYMNGLGDPAYSNRATN
jgi:hypothetical protein